MIWTELAGRLLHGEIASRKRCIHLIFHLGGAQGRGGGPNRAGWWYAFAILLVLAYPLRFEATLVRMTQFPSRDAFLNVVQYSPMASPQWRSQLMRSSYSIADCIKRFHLYYEHLVQTTHPCGEP